MPKDKGAADFDKSPYAPEIPPNRSNRSDQQMETDRIVCCMRVDDMPEPHVPSEQIGCLHCGAKCWRSNRSPKLPVICTRCATELPTDHDTR